MSRTFLLLAALLGFTGVAIGAFGAHGLRAHFEANPLLEPTFQTASEYHLIHAVALLGVALVAARWPSRWIKWSGWLLFAGLLIFSGSLYVLSTANARVMGAVAPIGGVLLLLGWASLFLAAWQHRDGSLNQKRPH